MIKNNHPVVFLYSKYGTGLCWKVRLHFVASRVKKSRKVEKEALGIRMICLEERKGENRKAV